MTMMTIREIKESDRNEYIAMATQFYSMPCCVHNVDKSHFEKAFDYCLQNNPYAKIFILERNKQIIGYGNISFTYSIEANGNVVWVEELSIKQEFQNKGYGKAYFDFIHTNFPAKRYRLEVTKSNINAMKLYERLGYEFLDYIQMIKER